MLEQLRRDCEAGDVIEGVVIGAECPRAKPHPDPYLIAMERLGVPAHDCVVFEVSRTTDATKRHAALRKFQGGGSGTRGGVASLEGARR